LKIDSPNFAFLADHDEQLVQLAALAERYFRDDPSTSLIKLRQWGEQLAQQVAARTGLFTTAEEPQADLLRRLKIERAAPQDVIDLFHQLRTAGNRATHDLAGEHRDALANLKIARQLAIWFHRAFGRAPGFKPGPFIPPPDPQAATQQLKAELDRLRTELQATQSAAEQARSEAATHAQARGAAEEQARQAAEERQIWEQLAQEIEREKTSLLDRLFALQQNAVSAPHQVAFLIEQGQQAAQEINLDEADTRAIIDQQLRDRGWEADSATLRYAHGARPAKGRNRAIAEWPTASGPADYALFVGTTCIGVVEAKRRNKNVSAAIDQAQRYSRGLRFTELTQPAGGPWPDGEASAFRVPFVFSANGRPYLKQLETESGIWFRDVRQPTSRRRALVDWFTPDGLKAELEIDRQAAQANLQTQSFAFGFPLRPYQQQAIQAIEQALAQDQRTMLVAMATGTGKTKLAIALLYRLLTTKRFRRVCFVVDRNALGQQTANEFSTTKVVGLRTFAEIFDLKGVTDTDPQPETKVHICTIQGLVRRVLYANEPAAVPPIDQYDLMVVDECHRGYLLDREMSDAELSFRSQAEYISQYRRSLEHFDAVKVGLTATPALHTVQIFGRPIFTYSYREAVIDGYLIDHEPPIRIETALSQTGITFAAGEAVELLDPLTGQVDLAQTPDELHFEVDAFNRRVITVEFNRAVAAELARHIDPDLPGKTLIFAVSNAHADIVVEEVKRALANQYGELEDAAVRKITGSVDQVGKLIRSYRNDDLPKIAVTVDLLTTGIDVPSIINLVFLRRVNSRILYEQMLGRATRRCDDIGKETFRIFDAVSIYDHLQAVTAMQPVVVDPAITFAQLFAELTNVNQEHHRRVILDQLLVKLRRRLKRLPAAAHHQYTAIAGETPAETLERLATLSPAASAAWANAHPGLGPILDWTADGDPLTALPISHHADHVVAVTRGYGQGQKPEDFLDSFTSYIRNNLNRLAALTVVVQRPRQLTRAQLRELRLELDQAGYSEANLRRAWYDAKNEDIAASIIGFIRQAALGDPLIPYAERVHLALRRILSQHPWSDPQRQWLQRIGEQLEREIVVDRASLDQEPFRAHGGFLRLNKIFNGQLETLLSDLNEELWRKAA
jgi:type I restriction enzyme R subunit